MSACSTKMGPFELEFEVFTTDSVVLRPQAWRTDGNVRLTEDLITGSGPARHALAGSQLTVASAEQGAHGASFRVCARLPEPVKAIKFALTLPAMRMHAPEEIEMPDREWRQWEYPAFWRAGFAIWEHEGRYFTLRTRDFPWHFKRLRVLREGGMMRVEVVQDANLRERSFDFSTSLWELGFCDDPAPLLADHADFVRQAFGASDFTSRPDVPAWFRDVGLVVNLHGMDWNANVHLDYAAMAQATETLADLFPADRTILYPIGWDGPYMRDYPTFAPAASLGGHRGFEAFCAAARDRGFHLMPHLNAMVCNARHPWYAAHLRHYVLRNALGNPIHCQHIDWDHDGAPDMAHSYVALEPRALRDVLCAAVDRLVRSFDIDAVFLDETCNVFYNDPAWDQVAGLRRLVRDLRRAHPDLLIAGEEWNEMLLGLTPLVQIWEETSDGRRAFGREKSSLMRTWAGQFVRACGYLALASPDGHTGVHEWPDRPWLAEAANEAYYIPTLSLTRETLSRGIEGVRLTIQRAEEYVRRFAPG